MTTGTALLPESTANQWDRATYAFLAEKQRRSGSDRTVAGYSGMLRHFFGNIGKTPDAPPSKSRCRHIEGSATPSDGRAAEGRPALAEHVGLSIHDGHRDSAGRGHRDPQLPEVLGAGRDTADPFS